MFKFFYFCSLYCGWKSAREKTRKETNMKILIVNGSPHAEGNTDIALREVQRTLESDGIETEYVHVGHLDVRGCVACGKCKQNGCCVFDDIVNEVAKKFEKANGIVVGSPVYYASPSGTMISFLDRLFSSTCFDKTMKVGASVAVCRRGGASATFDVLNKYFTISGMPVVSSQYWNSVHGGAVGQAVGDEEGLQTMRTLGHNMSFLCKGIFLAKQHYGLPEKEAPIKTSFIR